MVGGEELSGKCTMKVLLAPLIVAVADCVCALAHAVRKASHMGARLDTGLDIVRHLAVVYGCREP